MSNPNPKRAKSLLINLLEAFPFDPRVQLSAPIPDENIRITNFWSKKIIETFNRSGYAYLLQNARTSKDLGFTTNRKYANYFGTRIKLSLSFSRKSLDSNSENFFFIKAILKILVELLRIPENYASWDEFINIDDDKLDIYKSRFGASHYAGNTCYIMAVPDFCQKINDIFLIFFGNQKLKLVTSGDVIIEGESLEHQQISKVLVKSLEGDFQSISQELTNALHEQAQKEYAKACFHIRKCSENLLIDLLVKANITEDTTKSGEKKDVSSLILRKLVNLVRDNVSIVFHLNPSENQKEIDALRHYLLAFLAVITDSNPECHGQGSQKLFQQDESRQALLTERMLNFLVNSFLYFYSFLQTTKKA
ncbi:MAG: hypothetical protein ACTSYI_02360 [Promethearchaeota archaeon]